jgi:hypothetical protein
VASVAAPIPTVRVSSVENTERETRGWSGEDTDDFLLVGNDDIAREISAIIFGPTGVIHYIVWPRKRPGNSSDFAQRHAP